MWFWLPYKISIEWILAAVWTFNFTFQIFHIEVVYDTSDFVTYKFMRVSFLHFHIQSFRLHHKLPLSPVRNSDSTSNANDKGKYNNSYRTQ